MPAVPVIASGTPLTGANLSFMLRRPSASLLQAVAQTLTSGGAFKPINWDTELEDTDPDGVGMHSTATNPSRCTIRYPGLYRLEGAVGFASNATASRGAAWLVNGVVLTASDVMLPTVTTASTAARVPARSMTVRLAEGDYVELGGWHNVGADLNTATGTGASSMSVTFEKA